MQKTGRYEPPPELQQMEASGVFNLGQAFGPESRPLTRAGSRPATRPETPGPASHGGTMHLASLRAIIGQPASMQHLPERPTSALSGHGSSMQRPKTSRGKPSNGLSRPQTAGTLSSSFAGRFPVSSGTIPRPRVSLDLYSNHHIPHHAHLLTVTVMLMQCMIRLRSVTASTVSSSFAGQSPVSSGTIPHPRLSLGLHSNHQIPHHVHLLTNIAMLLQCIPKLLNESGLSWPQTACTLSSSIPGRFTISTCTMPTQG